jgi:Rrf2 family iron-sulfur cluster assembly transcriptional regulator
LERAKSVLVRDISDSSGVPRNYLSKILNRLRQQGLVRSERGPGGGFQLARSSQDISVYDIVFTFDDISRQRLCFMGDQFCAEADVCQAASQWCHVWMTYETFLRETTLDHLAFHDAKHPRTTAGSVS